MTKEAIINTFNVAFTTEYRWVGQDFLVRLSDQYCCFELKIIFRFEYDKDGKLCRDNNSFNQRGVIEFSEPMRRLASISSTTIERSHFRNMVELSSEIEKLPGWIREMIDMEKIVSIVNEVPVLK